jgi:hypothetical protein
MIKMNANKSYKERVNAYIKEQVELAKENDVTGIIVIDHSHIISDKDKEELIKLSEVIKTD